MTDESNAIETTVPAEHWDQLVQLYTRLLGAPQHPSDSEALFASPDDGLTIRLVKEDTTRGMTEIMNHTLRTFGGRDNAHLVEDAYKQIIKTYPTTAIRVITPQRIDRGNDVYTIAVVEVKGHGAAQMEDSIVCVVHNPNW
jgi:hypothetical protein